MKSLSVMSFAVAAISIASATKAQQAGPYAGLTLGASQNRFADPGNVLFPKNGVSGRSVVPGLIGGYNARSGRLVYGAEIAGAVPQSQIISNEINPGVFAPVIGEQPIFTTTVKDEWEGSLSARVGVNFDRWSLGLTAGGKVMRIKRGESFAYPSKAAPNYVYQSRSTALGPVIGIETGYDVSQSISLGLRLEHSQFRLAEPVKAGNGTERQLFRANVGSVRAMYRF